MSYHESFWVTIGAAAPVIALASTVSIADARVAREFLGTALYTRAPSPERTDVALRALRFNTLANLIGFANGFLQVVMLSLALYSLATVHDQTPLIIPGIAVPLGFFLLFAGSLIAASVRSLKRLLQ